MKSLGFQSVLRYEISGYVCAIRIITRSATYSLCDSDASPLYDLSGAMRYLFRVLPS